MVSIGNTTLPGASATVDSATAARVNTDSPGDVGLVGGADLGAGTDEGDANANEVYRVTSPLRARSLFGVGSPLTKNIIKVLTGGTYPVYAVAAQALSVVGEDISGLSSTSGTLTKGPGRERADAATFTVDGTTFTTILTLDDPSMKSPGAEEAYWNPTTQEFELGTAPSTSGEVDYEHRDYATALDTLRNQKASTVDFVGALSEHADVRDKVQEVVGTMETNKHFAIGVAGATTHITDSSAYSNPYDDSRMQLLYPARNAAGESMVGAYLGLRGAIGIERSAMKTVMGNENQTLRTMSESTRIDLDEQNLVLVANGRDGPEVLNDPTCVTDSNTEEAEMRDGLSRMLIDFVTDIVLRKSSAFIGSYHNEATRNQLRKVLRSALAKLRETGAVIDFAVHVSEIDAYTAQVELGVDTAQPLANIISDITAGDVDTGAVAVSA